ncbi:MAG TPA: DUF853 family protein [Spirochaetales bacterium]|nr:DUF853 family protein [Spirochaetales bacterium]
MSANIRLCRIPDGDRDLSLDLSMAARHGLVTGATGTGKTVTLQALAEGLSREGVSVFCCDIKGDLSGIAAPGSSGAKIAGAFGKLGLPQPEWAACPVEFWDVAGKLGLPLRATVSDLGPLLLSRLLALSDVQADVIRILFRVADERGLPVLDLKDLRALIGWVSDHAEELKAEYGLLSPQSLAALQRSVLVLEETGAGAFFGEPALSVADLLRARPDGRGTVHVLAAEALMNEPALYAVVMLHLLGELFEELPEAGDLPKPKLVLLVDEAHLLFDEAPKALVDAVERTARLVRSKGVGLWLVTQSPLDVPESVLGQLGNRVHHALRAYTPKDRAAVDSVADNLRPNPGLDPRAAITELGVGEALVSFLDSEGRPLPVERARVVPPASRVGPLSASERAALVGASALGGTYARVFDRESAYELLKGRATGGASPAGGASRGSGGAGYGGPSGGASGEPSIEDIEAELRGESPRGPGGASGDPYFRDEAEAAPEPERRPAPRTRAEPARTTRRASGGFVEDLARAAVQSASRELGRQLVRGLLGTRRRRR